MSKVKAIIFDCYNVLVDDGMPAFVEEHVQDAEAKRQIWEADDAVNLGEKTVLEFFEFLAKKADMTAEQVAQILDVNYVNQQLVEYIARELKPSYKLAILSNISGDILDDLIGKDNRALFDVEALSYKVGAVKPQSAIYEYCLEQLGVAPEECVFIDDKEHYCEGARRMGMQAIHYKNFDDFTQKLREVLAHEH